MRRIGKVVVGILAGLLCVVAVAGSLYRSQAQGGQSSSRRENAQAQVVAQAVGTPARGAEMSPEEKTVRDAYARLTRYHTAARDEAAAGRGVVYRAEDYMTIGVNKLRTGFIEEIVNRPLSEMVTPRGGEVISLKPKYLRGADGLAHASYDALWEALPEAGKADQTSVPTVSQALGEKYKGAVKYTSYEVTVSMEGKGRTYRALALHFNPVRGEGKPETEIVDNITSGMNTVLAERSPRIRSPWARYVRSDLHEAIVNAIRAKEQAGLPLIPADAPIGYLPGDEVEAANDLLASAANSCEPPPQPPSVTIADAKSVIKGDFTDFQVTLNPSPSNVPVTLNLDTTNGTGQALFDTTNSPSLTINQSTNVRIKGIIQSSAANNIRLRATADQSDLATQTLSVVQINRIQYKRNGTWTDMPAGHAGISDICQSSSITFKAVIEPTGAVWPDNKPVWLGDANGGIGEERTVTFSTSGSRSVRIVAGNTIEEPIVVGDANSTVSVTWPAASVTTSTTSGPSVTVDAPFAPTYMACADINNNAWRLRVHSISGGANITIRTGGSRDPFLNPPINNTEATDAVTVMQQYYTHGRGTWHTAAASNAHEGYHYMEWQCTCDHYWPMTEIALENLTVPYTSYASQSLALSALQAMTNGADVKITNFRDISRSYWGMLDDTPGSRPYAAGQLVLNSAIIFVQGLAASNGWTVPPGYPTPSSATPCYQAWLPYTP